MWKEEGKIKVAYLAFTDLEKLYNRMDKEDPDHVADIYVLGEKIFDCHEDFLRQVVWECE